MDIGKLLWLEKLNLSNNKLIKLPQTLTNCTQLLELKISFNQITMLLNDIDKCNNLQVIWLNDNQLFNLPHSLCSIESLLEVKLENNPFHSSALKNLTDTTDIKEFLQVEFKTEKSRSSKYLHRSFRKSSKMEKKKKLKNHRSKSYDESDLQMYFSDTTNQHLLFKNNLSLRKALICAVFRSEIRAAKTCLRRISTLLLNTDVLRPNNCIQQGNALIFFIHKINSGLLTLNKLSTDPRENQRYYTQVGDRIRFIKKLCELIFSKINRNALLLKRKTRN